DATAPRGTAPVGEPGECVQALQPSQRRPLTRRGPNGAHYPAEATAREPLLLGASTPEWLPRSLLDEIYSRRGAPEQLTVRNPPNGLQYGDRREPRRVHIARTVR